MTIDYKKKYLKYKKKYLKYKKQYLKGGMDFSSNPFSLSNPNYPEIDYDAMYKELSAKRQPSASQQYIDEQLSQRPILYGPNTRAEDKSSRFFDYISKNTQEIRQLEYELRELEKVENRLTLWWMALALLPEEDQVRVQQSYPTPYLVNKMNIIGANILDKKRHEILVKKNEVTAFEKAMAAEAKAEREKLQQLHGDYPFNLDSTLFPGDGRVGTDHPWNFSGNN